MTYRYNLDHDSPNIPPPLISYKKYALDLNSISCSASQPHYIALGGAHLHCFLHDRRMLGRDLAAEQGRTSGSPEPGTRDDELMGQATRCVRRFAPNGRKRMSARDSGHITACKISDANPNEMVVSWSGDHIYSFDLVQSPDAREHEEAKEYAMRKGSGDGKSRKMKDRKRKRTKDASLTSLASAGRAPVRLRRDGQPDEEGLSLRVQFQNGQSEDIPIDSNSEAHDRFASALTEDAQDSLLSEAQKLAQRIAKALVKLRKMMFDLDNTTVETHAASSSSSPEVTPHTTSFTSALGYASAYLPQMDEVIRTWRYPLNPTQEQVHFQKTLRRNRESARSFIQASGTLARVLGGRLRTLNRGESQQMEMFRTLKPALGDTNVQPMSYHFGYNFLRAIVAWLDGGPDAIVDAFKRPTGTKPTERYPLSDDDRVEAIDEKLIPSLLRLASDKPVVDLSASRFETGETRVVFDTQSAAVISFSNAIKIPLHDLAFALMPGLAEDSNGPPEHSNVQALDRRAAKRFWAFKVGRSILMEAGEGVNYQFVNNAFGGLRVELQDDDDEDDPERNQEDVDPDEDDDVVDTVDIVRSQPTVEDVEDEGDEAPALVPAIHVDSASNAHEPSSTEGASDVQPTDGEIVSTSASSDVVVTTASSYDLEEEQGDHGDRESGSEDDDEGEEEESDGEILRQEARIFSRRSAFGRSRERALVENDKPCYSHTRVYRGHCNVKTVKDVNFYGMNDEYVVSGSDSGHVFIWDRKSSQLMNILEGDGEVVNVVQGHPYEPMLAVSGIDSTIKIFSPDARLQHDARAGVNIANPSGTSSSSLRFHARRPHADPADAGLASRKRMHQSYTITSQNDVDRQGGMSDAYLTRSMLARLAATIHAGGATTREGGTIVLDDNCTVSVPYPWRGSCSAY